MDILNLECIYQCLNDDDQFYHQFLKVRLNCFQLCFEKDYLYQNLQQNYFKNMEKSKAYTDNNSSFVHLLRCWET